MDSRTQDSDNDLAVQCMCVDKIVCWGVGVFCLFVYILILLLFWFYKKNSDE